MANEVNQLTINAAGDSWVDSTPSAISTGYQAQNTNIQAHSVGQDLSSVRVSGTDVIVDISGPIDVDGIPFSVTSAVTLTPSSGGVYYIQVIAGATSTQKSLELTTSTPAWDASKNALYNGSNRVLNWMINNLDTGLDITRLNGEDGVGNNSETSGICGFVRWADLDAVLYPITRRNFSAPSTAMNGIAFYDGNLLSVSNSTGFLYIHDGITSAIDSSIDLGGGGRITVYNGNLIKASGSTINVYSGISATVSSSFSAPGTSCTGVAVADGNLITCDSLTGLIYIHSGITSTVSSNFAAPFSSPGGLLYNGKNLISGSGADTTTKRIYIHDGISVDISYSFNLGGGTGPVDIGSDGKRIFYIDTLNSDIYTNGV